MATIACRAQKTSSGSLRRWRSRNRPLAVLGTTVGGNLRAVRHAVVPDHACDAQSVIAEYFAAAERLYAAMRFEISPCIHRRLIAEDREREHFAGLIDALEPLDRDETIDLVEERPQLRGEVEVELFVLGLWPNFEDDRDHLTPIVEKVGLGPFSAGLATARWSPAAWRARRPSR